MINSAPVSMTFDRVPLDLPTRKRVHVVYILSYHCRRRCAGSLLIIMHKNKKYISQYSRVSIQRGTRKIDFAFSTRARIYRQLYYTIKYYRIVLQKCCVFYEISKP